jgi:glycerophosphoryl diester phosphodiesterase
MTKIFAHRGSSGTHPENTLISFAESVRIGVDGIELDVHLTKDEELVVIHDETINRTTNGKGLVSEYTVAELKTFDAGGWFSLHYEQETIPTLTEVLGLLTELDYQGTLTIEVKTNQKEYPGIEETLVRTIKNKDWPFVVNYSSFNLVTLQRLAELDPVTPKAWLTIGSVVTIAFANYFTAIERIEPNFSWFIQSEAELIELEKRVCPWTVNSEPEMWMCFERKVAGFHTDYPAQAIKLRQRYERKQFSFV